MVSGDLTSEPPLPHEYYRLAVSAARRVRLLSPPLMRAMSNSRPAVRIDQKGRNKGRGGRHMIPSENPITSSPQLPAYCDACVVKQLRGSSSGYVIGRFTWTAVAAETVVKVNSPFPHTTLPQLNQQGVTLFFRPFWSLDVVVCRSAIRVHGRPAFPAASLSGVLLDTVLTSEAQRARTKPGSGKKINLPRARCANAGRNSDGADVKIAHRNGNAWASVLGEALRYP